MRTNPTSPLLSLNLRARITRTVAAALVSLWLAPSAARAADPVTGALTVFAAASLTEALGAIAEEFKKDNAGATVTFNFAGSQQLATQIVEGAPADVFASASGEQMKRVDDAHLLAAPAQPFVANVLEIAVEPGNPEKIVTLADLARPGLTVVLAAPEVPAGKYAREALTKAGVNVAPASLEVDVRSALSKVTLGEADASIVYHSDVVASGNKVQGVAIPAEHNVRASYPIATLKAAPNPAGATAFVALISSERGRAVFERFGFTGP